MYAKQRNAELETLIQLRNLRKLNSLSLPAIRDSAAAGDTFQNTSHHFAPASTKHPINRGYTSWKSDRPRNSRLQNENLSEGSHLLFSLSGAGVSNCECSRDINMTLMNQCREQSDEIQKLRAELKTVRRVSASYSSDFALMRR